VNWKENTKKKEISADAWRDKGKPLRNFVWSTRVNTGISYVTDISLRT
jgi:hypothetical protein